MSLFGPYIALFRGKTSIIHGNQWRERKYTIYPVRYDIPLLDRLRPNIIDFGFNCAFGDVRLPDQVQAAGSMVWGDLCKSPSAKNNRLVKKIVMSVSY